MPIREFESVFSFYPPQPRRVDEEAFVKTQPSTFSGFSMVELVVVLAIIAVVSTITIPMGISYIRNYEVIGAAQNVASQMQQCRSQAVRRNSRRGLLLNFDYPSVGRYQFTTLDEDPVNGGWDGGVYPANPGVFDPANRTYGIAPTPPDNIVSPGGGLPSPHGVVVSLPLGMEFIGGKQYGSLLCRVDGSVEAVNAGNVAAQVVQEVGLNWEVEVRHPDYGLTRTITISRNGRVAIDNP
jgi:prepilin-type N-terminal cleavage/methylation domain-containing protein